MQPTPRHAQVETRFRALLDDAGLAPPDRVEHGPTSIVFCWDGPRVAVIVDFDRDDQEPLDPYDVALIGGLPSDRPPAIT
jgi:hypothetical protein